MSTLIQFSTRHRAVTPMSVDQPVARAEFATLPDKLFLLALIRPTAIPALSRGWSMLWQGGAVGLRRGIPSTWRP